MRIKAAVAGCLWLAVAGWVDAGERLVLEPYPGPPEWQEVTHEKDGNAWLREWIPSGQEIESYADILTAQSFPQQRGTAPAEFLRTLFPGFARACERVKVNGPKEHRDGYPVAYAQIYCNRQSGHDFGVVMFFKVIQGEESLYVVQREFRIPPSETPGVYAFKNKEQAFALLKGQTVANHYLVRSVCLQPSGAKAQKCPVGKRE